MRLYALLLAAAGALALAGCSSTPTKVESGPIQANTFSFVDRGGKPAQSDKRVVAAHAMIQEAITKNFAARGVTRKSTGGGDLTVGYLIIVGNNGATESINDYFGDSDAAAGLQAKAQDAYSASKNPNYFEAGTLVIDVIDGKTFKLLKRGYTTRPTLQQLPADAKLARIQDAVDEILRDVHITH